MRLLCLLVVLVAYSMAHADWSQKLPSKITAVYFDVQSGAVFTADHRGTIFKIKDGTAEQVVAGLSKPRGMRSFMGVLWVATDSGLVCIDLKRNRVAQEIAFPDDVSLADVTVDRSGAVYAVDAQKGVLWKNQKRFLVFPRERLSSVLIVLDQLYVLSNRALRKIDLKSKRTTILFRWKREASGGLELASSGAFLLGDTQKNLILYVSRGGKILGSKNVPGATGDFGYRYFKESSQDLLLLPIEEESLLKAVSATL